MYWGDKWRTTRPFENPDGQRNPIKQFFFVCEGKNTETFYFCGLDKNKNVLGIDSMVKILVWGKGAETEGMTKPDRLLELAENKKAEEESAFREGQDEMIIVFDADIFEENKDGYYESIIRKIEEKGNVAAVTNPNFELFLLLHVEGTYEKYIKGNENEFLKKVNGSCKYAFKLFKDETGINSKKSPKVGEYAALALTAIEQESHLNQDVHKAKGNLTSNIGKIIKSIIDETPQKTKISRTLTAK